MKDPRDDIVNKMITFLEKKGIDPLHMFTLLALILALSYYKELRNWEEIEDWRKGLIMGTIFCASLMLIVSILRLLAIIEF